MLTPHVTEIPRPGMQPPRLSITRAATSFAPAGQVAVQYAGSKVTGG
jgi:hypothetical protein